MHNSSSDEDSSNEKNNKLEIRYDGADGPVKLLIDIFDLNKIAKQSSMVIVAKRRSGKSVLVKALLHHFSKTIPTGIIISATEDADPFFTNHNFFPTGYVFKEYNTDVIRDLLNHQEELLELQKENPNINIETIVVMDDCLAKNSTWNRDPGIREMLMNGRHYHITFILTMQYPLGIGPDLRTNFDYRFFLADDQPQNIKKLFELYAGIFPDFRTFTEIFKQVIPKYRSLVICNTTADQQFSEKVFWYRAPKPDDPMYDGSRFGCKQFWRYHDLNFNEDWKKKKLRCAKKKKDNSIERVHK